MVSPNADTLYSIAWLNLSKEPMVLSVPTTNGRYYLMQMLDAWTNVFASPGTRTTGTGAGNFAIVGPRWNGTLPTGLTKIEAPTDMVWIVGRTQQNGPADIPAARARPGAVQINTAERVGHELHAADQRAGQPQRGYHDTSLLTR